MKSTISLIFSIVLLNLSISCLGNYIVETSYGRLIGKTIHQEDGNHYQLFKSVPFAKPPVGSLRFELPQEPNSWDYVRNATEYSPACPTTNSSTNGSSVISEIMSEDCLYLNVFTSKKCLETSKCAVIIYYHGGGIHHDSAIMFPDDFIFDRYVKEDIVFVIPAYRLGVFGLYNFGDEKLTHQNLALHDCIASLHFVHNEVQHFGGDPKNVTLMGHSAGGAIVTFLGVSRFIDPDRKLFQRVISLSMIPHRDPPQLFYYNVNEMTKRSGCNIFDEISEKLNCMKNKSYEELLQVQYEMDKEKLKFWNLLGGPPFMEKNETVEHLLQHAVPHDFLFGCTKNENGYNKKNINPATSGDFWSFNNPIEVGIYFDNLHSTMFHGETQTIFVSMALYSKYIVNNGGTVYIYSSDQEPNSDHVSDMQYFIGVHREKVHTPDMDILDSFYSKMLANFTKFGNPSPAWTPLDVSKMNYYSVLVDTKNDTWPSMKENFHKKEVDLWKFNVTNFDKFVTIQKTKRFNVLSTQNFHSSDHSVLYLLVCGVSFLAFMIFVVFRKNRHSDYILLE